MSGLINGVPAEAYGMWCQHGKRLMVPTPGVEGDYPGTVFADPWPCEVCTPDGLAAELQAEENAWQAAAPKPVDPDVEELEAWVRGETSVLGNPELDAVTAMRRSRVQ